jgi:hypothetical protein
MTKRVMPCGAALQLVERSRLGEIGTLRHLRITADWPNDMNMTIAAHRRY